MNRGKTLVLDVKKNVLKEVQMPEKLSDFYKLLDCDIIETFPADMYGLIIVCDEMGLFKANQRVSAYDRQSGEPIMVGSILFVRKDGDRWVGLTEEDMQEIRRKTVSCSYIFRDKPMNNLVYRMF